MLARRSSLTSVLVLAVLAPAGGQSVLTPTDDLPTYEISDLRLSRGRFGRMQLTARYQRIKEGAGHVMLAGQTRSGSLQITGPHAADYAQPSGTIELSIQDFGFGRGGYDYELYFVVPAVWAGKTYGHMLVSNTARIGNPGPATTARDWNEAERAAYEKNKLRDIPPDRPPAGYVAVDAGTPMAAGMPIQVGYYGGWVDAEYLGDAAGGKAVVRFPSRSRGTVMKRVGWVCALPDDLARARSNPSSFNPSMRTLPGGVEALPDNLVPIPADLTLPKGAPVMRYSAIKWEVQHVVHDFGKTVKVLDPSHRDFFGRSGSTFAIDSAPAVSRNELSIEKKTFAALKDPKLVAAMAENLVYKGDGFNDGPGRDADEDDAPVDYELDDFHVVDRDYPIERRIPDHSVQVPRGVELPKGTAAAYDRGRRWMPVDVVHDDGDTLIVKKKDWPGHIAYRLDRDQLIIQKKTLAELQPVARNAAQELQKTLRTWTDATGNFKVEARFVRRHGDKVTLKTGAGREITLPIVKLSDDDRNLLDTVVDEADNPFAG